MQKVAAAILDARGAPLAGVSISVNLAGSQTLATIYSDNGVTPKANPLTNDANGTYEYYAPNGRYDEVPSKPGVIFDLADFSDLVLFDPNQTGLQGLAGCRGQDSKNNATTPNTKYDLTAEAVALRSATNETVLRYNPGTITCDIGVAGPAVNGRDQAAAFGANSWLHFYWIWNGTTLGTTASLTPPPTGPALPAGYTHWAYAGAVRLDGSSNLIRTRIKGASAFYETQQSALVTGGATTETAVSLSSLVPPNALAALLRFEGRSSGDNAGGADDAFILRVVSGSTFFHLSSRANTVGSNFWNAAAVLVPNISQQVYYLITRGSSGGTAPTLDIHVLGYRLPNGDA